MRFHILTITERADRHAHIVRELEAFPQYEFVIHSGSRPPREQRCASLYEKMAAAIRESYEDPWCIVLEDDHMFTPKFFPENLSAYLQEGRRLELDVLLGGVEYYTAPEILHASHEPFINIIGVQNFVGTQCCIFFKRFYDRFLAMTPRICPEELLSMQRSIRKGVTYPFISMQADFPSEFGRAPERRQSFIDSEGKMIRFFMKNQRNAIHDGPGNI